MTGKSKKRHDIPQELEELRQLVTAPLGDAEIALLRRALRERSSLAAERAAMVARDRNVVALESDLVYAFERLLQDPVKRDPGCRGKLAAIEALDSMDTADPAPFLVAARHFQLEPAWGPPVDTAVGLRARALVSLARLAFRDLPLLAGELLLDPESPVRQAAADALARFGERAAASALLVVLRKGDDDPLVTTACMESLLSLAPDWGLPKVREALFGSVEVARESAALALAQSRRDDALTVLLEYLDAAPRSTERAVALRAIGLHRTERALDALLEVLATSSVADAKASLEGLAPRRWESGLRERTFDAVQKNGSPAVAAAFMALFGDVDPAEGGR